NTLCSPLVLASASIGSWTAPINISNNAGYSVRPEVAIGSDGTIHVVWDDTTTGNSEILYTAKPLGGFWSTPLNISNNLGNSTYAGIGVDAGGTVHVVWNDTTPGNWQIFYSSRTPSGAWSYPLNISNSTGDSDIPAIAIDNVGTVHVVWEVIWDTDGGYTQKPQGGSWSTPVSFSNHHPAYFPDIVADSEGTVHVVWEDPTISPREISYNQKPITGSWLAPINISNNPGFSEFPAIDVNGSNNVHAVWDDYTDNPNGDIFYATKADADSWSTPINVSNDPADSLAPRIAIDGGKTLHIVWQHYTPGGPTSDEILYAYKLDGGSWSVPINVSSNSGLSEWPAIAVDAEGTLHVVWDDNTLGNWEILYASCSRCGTPSSGDPYYASHLGSPSSPTNQTVAEPVSVIFGNYTYQHTDLSIPGRGLPVTLERTYNSITPSVTSDGPFGYGWTHAYALTNTQETTSTVMVKNQDGRLDRFTDAGSGNYTPPPGTFNTLTKNPDGTYTLVHKDQTRYNFNLQGRLATIVDKNGNTTTLTYTGNDLTQITDSAGRLTTLACDANHHIT
ncbi:MAG: hypothetical protein FJZ88_05535, partial [Chloroflexi bacterium]|nr:hypothetical protein [Chloroflexota bacterium]